MQTVLVNSAHVTARQSGYNADKIIAANYRPNAGRYFRECREESMKNPSNPMYNTPELRTIRWLRT